MRQLSQALPRSYRESAVAGRAVAPDDRGGQAADLSVACPPDTVDPTRTVAGSRRP